MNLALSSFLHEEEHTFSVLFNGVDHGVKESKTIH